MKISTRVILLISCVTATLVALPLWAEVEHHGTELAKKLQNPVSDLISVPFQNNFNFGVGPEDKTQYVLNIQPVLPQRISEQWNWIHRAIIPLIDQPAPVDAFGLGDIQYQGFLSPAKPGKLIWGVGPVLQVPSATDDQLGTEKWSMPEQGLEFDDVVFGYNPFFPVLKGVSFCIEPGELIGWSVPAELVKRPWLT